MNILLVEDSEALRRSILVGLSNLGFTVDEANDGAIGLSMALTNDYDLLILDLMLPNVSGMDILRSLRQHKKNTRVLILSAKSMPQDKIDGLMQGADDYLTKPFSFEELKARVIALLRRGQMNYASQQYYIGDFCLDLDNMLFSYQAQQIELTKNEFKLLSHLFSNKDRIVSVESISEAIVGNFDAMAKNTIESHLSSIRKKVRQLGGELPIKNKRGFGYLVETTSTQG